MQSGQDGLAACKRLNEDSAFLVVMLHLSVHRSREREEEKKIRQIYCLTQAGKHLALATAAHLLKVQKRNAKMHLHNRAVWLCEGDFSAV